MIPARRISGTSVNPVLEFIDHHTLKDIGLIVDVVEDVFPENIQSAHWNEEAVHAHPKTVGESGDCEGDYEDGEDGTDEDDEGFGSDEVEEEPEHPDPEGVRCVVEISEPVFDEGEEDGDEEEIGETDEEICDCEGEGAAEAIGAFFGEGGAVFEVGGHVGDGHEGHECGAEEDGVDEGLDGGLGGGEAEEDGAH